MAAWVGMATGWVIPGAGSGLWPRRLVGTDGKSGLTVDAEELVSECRPCSTWRLPRRDAVIWSRPPLASVMSVVTPGVP